MRKTHFILLLLVFATSCTNPFAPALLRDAKDDFQLGDQRTVEGVFKNFSYAYKYKDTVLYGKLLHPDFTFNYRNYDKNIDPTWTRSEDMIATARLFAAAQDLNLVWNEILYTRGDSLFLDVSRSFSLTITFAPNDILNVFGKAIFYLKRENPSQEWKIILWRDESNF